jgi:single-stranded-DNA-specific exonuclease
MIGCLDFFIQASNHLRIQASKLKYMNTNQKPSANQKFWQQKKFDENFYGKIRQNFGVSDITAKLISERVSNIDEVENFLNPTIKNSLPNPSDFLDMDKAAKRIYQAILSNEKICIFGDYDVDGATASALLKRFLRDIGYDAEIYIPDRILEGYGPNTAALLALKEKGIDLVITVDCGVTSFEPLLEAKKAGLDIVVIDHHLGVTELPEAVAVVNPNRIDETSPHKNLCAAGMAFILAVAINRELKNNQKKSSDNILNLLDLVALGTVCDVMTLTGLNRAYVSQGLKIMAKRGNLGLKTLADFARLTEAPNVYALGFALGPRINAGGRIGRSWLGSKLLSTDDEFEANEIAAELDKLNEERKAIEFLALEEAHLAAEKISQEENFIALASPKWHAGIIGIVASRIKDKFDKATAIISITDGIGKGSARSVSGVDIGGAIAEAKLSGLLINGGGHKAAGGFTVEENKIPELQKFISKKIESDYKKYKENKITFFDAEISVQSVTKDLFYEVQSLAPFGMGNPEPKFMISDAVVTGFKVLNEKHIMLFLNQAGIAASSNPLKAMCFNCVGSYLGEVLQNSNGKKLLFLGTIKINKWQGTEKTEFFIDDAISDV